MKESDCNFVWCKEVWAKEEALGSGMEEMMPGHPDNDSTIHYPTSWFDNVADANGCSGRDHLLNGDSNRRCGAWDRY